MRELSGLQSDTAGPVQHAVRHHLDSGGSRTRATIGVAVGTALDLVPRDTVAVAAAAELLHNASLIHDDLQDQSKSRRDNDAVWARFGENLAICAGDLLVSAAYASLAQVSEPELAAELVTVAHAATARVINGQAQDLALQQACVKDFDLYREVAGEKSGPLLGLPLELALTAAGQHDYVPVARDAATSLATAYQIADDLEDEQRDVRKDAPSCLNAVAVLRNAGYIKPRQVARYQATLALRDAMRLSMYLPSGSGESMLECIEAVSNKLRASAA